MVSRTRSLGLQGIGGYEVSVECFLSGGLPGFDVVGLPDAAVKEARDRVRAAIKNCGMKFPVSRVTVNLAPADTRKAGTIYDLPILLGILVCTGELSPLPAGAAFLGELSLAGELRPVRGALPMALAARRLGVSALFVPAENAAEAAFAEGLTVYPVATLTELLAHLRGETRLTPADPPPLMATEETVWCGERKGRRVTMGTAASVLPATEWISVASVISRRLMSGRMPGRRLASMLLPAPGGPIIRTLCPPAAATSSARLTFSCALTSAKSGRGAPSYASSAGGSAGDSGASPRRCASSSARFWTG